MLADLQRLREHRWFGELPAGQRDSWLFLACVAISWLAPPCALRREISTLAEQAGGWNERETNSRMSSAIDRAEKALRGETLTWNGKAIDPHYKFRAATMIEWLGITPDEMRGAGLRVLVNEDVRRDRAAERQQGHRRREGLRERRFTRPRPKPGGHARGHSAQTASRCGPSRRSLESASGRRTGW